MRRADRPGACRGTHRRTRPRRRLPRALAAAPGSLLVVVAVAAGVGAVITLGAGVGSAGSAPSTVVTLSPGVGGGDLKPGGQGRVRLTVSNNAGAAVVVRRLVLDTAHPTGGFEAGPGCPASAFSYAAQDNGGAGWSVPARSGGVAGTRQVDLPGAVTMSAAAPDGCQGATVTVYLSAQG